MNAVMRTCASTRSFFVFFFLLCVVVPGFGQSNYAEVTGTVTDSQSLPVTGATVSLKALSTGAFAPLQPTREEFSLRQRSCLTTTN